MKRMLLILFAVIGLAACNNNDDDPSPVQTVRETFESPELQGETFVGPCRARPVEALITALFTGGESSAKSMRTQYEFAGASVTRRTQVFTEAECKGEPALSFVESGTMDVHDENKKTNDGGRYIDFMYNTLTVKVLGEPGAKIANAVQLCGSSDWAAAQERNVTANAEKTNCYGVKVPRTIPNIFRVDDDTLYLGKHERSTNEERPSALDMQTKFVEKD